MSYNPALDEIKLIQLAQGGDDCPSRWVRCLAAEILNNRQGSAWISVEDRLPCCETDVVLYPDFSGDPVIGFLVSGDGIFVDNDNRKVDPTHWMILTPAPEN